MTVLHSSISQHKTHNSSVMSLQITVGDYFTHAQCEGESRWLALLQSYNVCRRRFQSATTRTH